MRIRMRYWNQGIDGNLLDNLPLKLGAQIFALKGANKSIALVLMWISNLHAIAFKPGECVQETPVVATIKVYMYYSYPGDDAIKLALSEALIEPYDILDELPVIREFIVEYFKKGS